MPTPLIRVVKNLPLPGTREGNFSTNRNFLYNKCKFTLPKENLFPAFRAFPVPVGSQWPQNNPYAKKAQFGVACSGAPQPPSTKAPMLHTPRVASTQYSVRMASLGSNSIAYKMRVPLGAHAPCRGPALAITIHAIVVGSLHNYDLTSRPGMGW